MEPDSPLHTNLVALLIVISGMVPGTTAPPPLTESTTAPVNAALAAVLADHNAMERRQGA